VDQTPKRLVALRKRMYPLPADDSAPLASSRIEAGESAAPLDHRSYESAEYEQPQGGVRGRRLLARSPADSDSLANRCTAKNRNRGCEMWPENGNRPALFP
jgi:hypothetical protein